MSRVLNPMKRRTKRKARSGGCTRARLSSTRLPDLLGRDDLPSPALLLAAPNRRAPPRDVGRKPLATSTLRLLRRQGDYQRKACRWPAGRNDTASPTFTPLPAHPFRAANCRNDAEGDRLVRRWQSMMSKCRLAACFWATKRPERHLRLSGRNDVTLFAAYGVS
jgi:hypothetical protein